MLNISIIFCYYQPGLQWKGIIGTALLCIVVLKEFDTVTLGYCEVYSALVIG